MKQNKLPESTAWHGLQTLPYIEQDGRVMVRLSVRSQNDNEVTKYLSADTATYWYPLYFYYDWAFDYHQPNTMVLKAMSEPLPEITAEALVQPRKNTLEVFIGNEDNNIIYKDNVALLKKFKTWELASFEDDYDTSDVIANFTILSAIIDDVYDKCESRYIKDKDDKYVINTQEQSQLSEVAMAKVLSYATDTENRILIQVGCAHKMTGFMAKVLRAKKY